MEQDRLEKLRAWFDDYVAGFYGDNDFVNANVKLKEQHSKRTCKEMLELAEKLGLSDNQKRIAEVTALFHDIGRFEQFARYGTYNDPRSVDHCLLGVRILSETNTLNGLEDNERELIEKAIEYHGLKELPADLDGECLLFSKMIRDADKIDALYVVTDYYRQYENDPNGFNLEVELPNEPWYSEQVVDEVLHGRRVDYRLLQTWNDMKLCQLAWVYDVNFTPTLQRIRQSKFLETILEFLPRSRDIEKVKQKIFQYVDSRIERQTGRKTQVQ